MTIIYCILNIINNKLHKLTKAINMLNLNESLNSTPYEFKLDVQNGNNFYYTFEDEREHGYRVHVYRRKKYGEQAWVSVIGEKTSGLNSYKRVVGKFNDVNKTLATLAAIYKNIAEAFPMTVHGILVEIPEKSFISKERQLRTLFRNALRGVFTVPEVMFTDDETEKLGFLSIAIIRKPFKYEDIFNIGSGIHIDDNNKTQKTDSSYNITSDKDLDTLSQETLAYYEEKVKRNHGKWKNGTIKLYRGINDETDIKDAVYKSDKTEVWTTKAKLAKLHGTRIIECEVPYTALIASHESLEKTGKSISTIKTVDSDVIVNGDKLKGLTAKVYNVEGDKTPVVKTFESFLNYMDDEFNIDELVFDEIIDII